MPFIESISHSWPSVNLMVQLQPGMLCVQVKLSPSWITSVTTLWSASAFLSPVKEKCKFQAQIIQHLSKWLLTISMFKLKHLYTSFFQKLIVVLLSLKLVFPWKCHGAYWKQRSRGRVKRGYESIKEWQNDLNLPLPLLFLHTASCDAPTCAWKC